jgi:hypothetical protein
MLCFPIAQPVDRMACSPGDRVTQRLGAR